MTKKPFIAHSEITDEIYIVCGAEKYLVTEQVIKAMQDTGRLEQQPSEDKVIITMDKGTLKYSSKGYVVYNKDWFKKHFATEVEIMTGYDGYKEQQTSDETIKYLECNDIDIQKFTETMKHQPLQVIRPTSDDCVSRADVIKVLNNHWLSGSCSRRIIDEQIDKVKAVPPVTPTHCMAEVKFSKEDLREICNERIEIECTHGTCKVCKHWKDSDGVYRRGIGAESKCPINIKEVYEGNFYCADFEKRG